MLLSAIIFITLALIFYTIGVWAEKIKGTLKTWHVVIFWMGFLCDTIGTGAMSRLSTGAPQAGASFHMITGLLAIFLMLFHAVWATIVMMRKDEKMKKSFHKFSVIVWIIWLIPYLSGMMMGMGK